MGATHATSVVVRTVAVQWREAGQDAGTLREVRVPTVDPGVPGLLACGHLADLEFGICPICDGGER